MRSIAISKKAPVARIEPAARVAVSTVRASVAGCRGLEEVIFCCFSAGDLAVYQDVLEAAG